MKFIQVCIVIIISCCIPFISYAQSSFSIGEYSRFLEDNRDLTGEQALSRHAPKTTYYRDIESGSSPAEVTYLDSVAIRYGLTEPELELLAKNHFVITERLNYSCFGHALHDIYGKDLPVFVSTDAILHALHASYDHLLMDIERKTLEPNLSAFLNALYNSFPQLLGKYKSNSLLYKSLGDVDLYVTMAKSLLENSQLSPQYINPDEVNKIWEAVQSEQMVAMPLFSEKARSLDFSQFTVRGHYTDASWGKPLGPYFKCMMWLGRMDFMLTAPPSFVEEWTKDELRRMNLSAVLLHELVEISGARSLLNKNDEIIRFMIGESDNLTPDEFAGIVNKLSITGAADLLDDARYDAFLEALTESADYGQRILSNFFIMDPYSAEPDKLPVSFRLMGQRFIIDSYIFSNVVYDRIIYEDCKIWRPMPDPLDAMFALGNDDALKLLQEQLDTYKYSSQLTSLRYLVDAYDEDFWNMSLYNVWLQTIRQLNPPEDTAGFPPFMQTAAWHQEKLNTQLSSWAQLRHDTLLYAKQSYTGGTVCSYPHSFVEPYPAFYRKIAEFAEKAESYFDDIYIIKKYFSRLKSVVSQLEVIAQKELNGEAFSDEEIEFLQRMLFVQEYSGAPPFSGWYADLFYEPEDAAKIDFIVADVHTQPTDIGGSVVGRILHVGVGKINLGVFIADSPSDDFRQMAFVGPVMSYYEKITGDFDRLTDERWTDLVNSSELPARPDWVNVYLADYDGNVMTKGRELPAVKFTQTSVQQEINPGEFCLLRNYPNPFNSATTIYYTLPQDERVNLTIYDVLGQKIVTLADDIQPAGYHTVKWNAGDVSSGIYFCRIQAGTHDQAIKMLLMQ